ncbi:tRNA pseudouridine(38-40) synthase TruA [Sphingobacterium pedocola]|uniref:tRNA pseudouridine synthase A n=1 Tax=Sphingobacterium pedocola TaxID=2082722 RepID=A0ABR9TBX3_9SPHI|nr:tRNA pseudouridine(38-40) synthase TruA [Sphingobacterium pedocola]MBE8722865.1 tRNA pseudouridine(38-40) synthase TruA [Sphingobacterium pedocola]
MKRFFLEIAYDGTAYHGWQMQPNAVSVQEKLDRALQTLLRERVETIGAGRTDTGVHAKQLYVHFDSGNAQLINNPDRFIHSLNAVLPFDISVSRLLEVPPESHARFDASERSYEYHIHFTKDPFLINKSWQLRDRPNVQRMNEAAKLLLGKKDFGCFSKSNTQVFTNICTITEAKWEEIAEKLVFCITADRFLRNMVRAIVGTLLEVGAKGQPISFIKEVLASQDRSRAGTSVPAHGLYLTQIKYPYIDPIKEQH